MKDLKQLLATTLALCVMSGSALALDQRRDQDRSPPKEVKIPKKEDKNPPLREENKNRGREENREGRRGRP